MKGIIYGLLIFTITFLSSCGGVKRSEEETAIISFYKSIENNDYEKAYSMLDNESRAKITFEQFKQLIKSGKIKSVKNINKDKLKKVYTFKRDGAYIKIFSFKGKTAIDTNIFTPFLQKDYSFILFEFCKAFVNKNVPALKKFLPEKYETVGVERFFVLFNHPKLKNTCSSFIKDDFTDLKIVKRSSTTILVNYKNTFFLLQMAEKPEIIDIIFEE